MSKSLFSRSLIVLFLFIAGAVGDKSVSGQPQPGQAQPPQTQPGQTQSQTPAKPPAQPQTPAKPPVAAPQTQQDQSTSPLRRIVPSEFNIRIESDPRTFVVMAAINVAGFDYETAGQPLTPARVEIRKDLANLDP